MGPRGIMFHHFYDERHPKGQGAISRDDLRRMLAHLGPERILSAQEWMVRAREGRLRPEHICLTFDDALLCQFDVAFPVLREFGITAFWFVYSSVFEGNLEPLEIYRYFRTVAFDDIDDFYAAFFAYLRESEREAYARGEASFDPAKVLPECSFYSTNDRFFRYLRDDILGPERYTRAMDAFIAAHDFDVAAAARKLWLTADHLAELDAAGHEVGLHSYSHPTRLCSLSLQQQRAEYEANFRHLSRVLDRPPVTMSHPCNSYTADTLEILADLGIALGFRADMEPVARRGIYEYPREDHADLLRRVNAATAATLAADQMSRSS